jgi:RNA polymerase sigma factor (sigma-70 family)
MTIVQRREGEHPDEYRCAQAGCKDCLDRLLQQNEALIHYIVRRQCPGEADYSDLIQEGWIGLWQAILHFEPERGYAFSSFAGKAIRNRVWNAVKQAGKAEGWMEPQRAGDSLAAILTVWQAEQLHQALEEELGCLPESLREVIELAYGLDGQAALNLAAIGRQLGLTRERVRQKRNEALGWLGLPAFSLRLRGLYEQDSRSNYRQARRHHDDWRRMQRGRR